MSGGWSSVCDSSGMAGAELRCRWMDTETASNCDNWIGYDTKCCCCVLDCSIPAGYSPDVVCCGGTLCCATMPQEVNAEWAVDDPLVA